MSDLHYPSPLSYNQLDAISHQSRGQALVRFTDVDSAQRAIDALHGYKFPGTAKGITVKFADSDQAKQDRRKRVERKMMAASRYSPYAPPPYQAPTSYAQYHQYPTYKFLSQTTLNCTGTMPLCTIISHHHQYVIL